MHADDDNSAISASDAKRLFADWKAAPAIVLAVSGGPDSIALMWLAARWRRALARGPRLIAVTVDHGLRAEAAREARDVKRLAQTLDLPHRTLRWTGAKPKTGLPAAARAARYRLLAQAARTSGATHILTAHTRDDQAETLLMRMLRGSGIAGLAAMARQSRARRRAAGAAAAACSKARLIATLEQGQDRLRRRSDQSRHEFHPAAAARADAGACRRGRRCAQSGAAGVAAGPRQCRGGSSGRRRRALSRADGIADASAIGLRCASLCRAAGRNPACGCCCARSIGSAMRGRPNSARSKPCWRRWTGRWRKSAGRRPRLKQTLAGALISLADGRIRIEPAPPRRRAQGRIVNAVTDIAAILPIGLNHPGKHRLQRHYLSGNRARMR